MIWSQGGVRENKELKLLQIFCLIKNISKDGGENQEDCQNGEDRLSLKF